MTLPEPISVMLTVADVLESLGIPYFVGGSFASAAQGAARSTLDADIIADLRLEHVEAIVQALGHDFYCDAEMIYDAIQHRSSFNLIHLATMFKVDVFVNKGRAFDRSQFERRVIQQFSADPPRSAYIASPGTRYCQSWYGIGWAMKCQTGNGVILPVCSQHNRAGSMRAILRCGRVSWG
jgi:hypothetical protein